MFLNHTLYNNTLVYKIYRMIFDDAILGVFINDI